MLIFTDNVNIFCYLFNPKCGCYTFNEVILPQIRNKYKILYHSNKSLGQGCSYNSFQYHHCNLEGAINYMQNNNIDSSKVIFFTIIRDPVKRYISAYNYSLSYSKITKFCNDSKDINEDFEKYLLNDGHFINFIPSKFRFYKQYSVNNIIKLENFKDDLNNFFKKYNLNIGCNAISKTKLNVSKNKEEITVSDEKINIIKQRFKEDFVSGNY